MKKSSFILLLIISLSFSMRSQTWEALGDGLPWQVRGMYSDTVDHYLYATFASIMHTPDGRQLKGIARWDGAKWDSVGNGLTAGSNTFAFARYNNKLYVGGVFDSVGYLKCNGLGTWDGNSWDTMSVQPFKSNFWSGAVFTLDTIDGELYIGGLFDSINNIPCKSFAKWDGLNFTPIGFPPNIYGSPYVFSICKYEDYIYIGGNFHSDLAPIDTIMDIIRYDGANWSSVGGGLKGSLANITSMVVYNGELYTAGRFYISDGNTGNSIQKWNGTSWSDVGGGLNHLVQELIVHQGKLYALGQLEYAGGVYASRVASWDGFNWCSEGSYFDNALSTGCIYNDTLCVGGGFWTIDGDSMNYISKYTGDGFSAACGNTSGVTENSVNSISIYPNPATDHLTIEYQGNNKKSAINIQNTLGQIIYTRTISDSKFEIDIRTFPTGVYILQLLDGTNMLTKKFIKQ